MVTFLVRFMAHEKALVIVVGRATTPWRISQREARHTFAKRATWQVKSAGQQKNPRLASRVLFEGIIYLRLLVAGVAHLFGEGSLSGRKARERHAVGRAAHVREANLVEMCIRDRHVTIEVPMVNPITIRHAMIHAIS